MLCETCHFPQVGEGANEGQTEDRESHLFRDRGRVPQKYPLGPKLFSALPCAGLLKRSPFCNHLKHGIFHQNTGTPPFTSCNVQVYGVRIPVVGGCVKGKYTEPGCPFWGRFSFKYKQCPCFGEPQKGNPPRRRATCKHENQTWLEQDGLAPTLNKTRFVRRQLIRKSCVIYYLPFALEYYLFSPVGFEGNLTIGHMFNLSGGLKQMEVTEILTCH